MSTRILRLKRTDKPSEHLLVNVKQTSKAKPINLKLVATDQEHLYHGSTKESSLRDLQASNSSGSIEEWKQILQYALLQQHSNGKLSETTQGVEIVGAISGETCTITIRKNISGITQRLGSIKLDQDDEREEVSAFDWVDAAVQHSDAIRSQLDNLQASVHEQQAQVTKLTQQLDDLVKAKKEHEEELLKKFAALLNSKKLKIRDQQRLLAGAEVKPDTADAVGVSRNGTFRRGAGANRKGKRKANGNLNAEEVAEEEDDPEAAAEDDAMEDEDLKAQEDTPQNSDHDATEDEDSDAEGFAPQPTASRKTNPAAGNKGRALEVVAHGHTPNRLSDSRMEDIELEEPPPLRELSFVRKGSKKEETKPPGSSQTAVHDDEDDDDETDDEL